MSIIARIARYYRARWTPRALDVGGFGFIIAAVALAFGLAPALFVTGCILLVSAWAISEE